MTDVELYKSFQKSPILFIEYMWKLTPERDNTKFIKGKHITWQQHDLLLAVEAALRGEGKKRISVRSGHGVGKSTVLAWLVIWYLFCFKDAQIPCTAPTSEQMYDVLWKELKKWLTKLPKEIEELFDWTTGYLRIKESPETWFARARTARKEAPEALQGIHGDYVMIIVDEASGVPDEVFEAAEGALTSTNILVIMIANPTRLTGYFYDSHHRDAEAWYCMHFDSTESPLVDEAFAKRIEQKYDLASDEYQFRVKGNFPAEDSVDDQGYVPLLSPAEITQKAEQDSSFAEGVKMGIDPAGEGKDETVWVVRDSFKARVVAKEKISNSKSITEKTLTLMKYYNIKPENIVVDSFGVGANVIQELAIAGKYVKGINVGDRADDHERYTNRRAEAFWRLREWLHKGGYLVLNTNWDELKVIRYKQELNGKMKIMSKHEMKRNGIMSPNCADALMLSFVVQDVAKTSYIDPYILKNGTAYVPNE